MKQIIKDKREIINQIRKIRREKNITQEELARKIGCTKAAISSYESCKTEPRFSVFVRMCEELDYIPFQN